jgi:uncharacterized protein (TIGR03437 family)
MTEGFHMDNPSRGLFIVNNTIVNERSSGSFVTVHASVMQPAVVRNNIVVGNGPFINQSNAILEGNLLSDPGFVNRQMFDYALRAGSAGIDTAVAPGSAGTYSLSPTQVYVHPACTGTRGTVAGLDVGAYELGWPVRFESGPERCRAVLGGQPGTPPVIQAAVNAASFLVGHMTPGSIATVFGENLADREAGAAQLPLPVTLGGTSVLLRGIPSPIFYASPGQVNFQVPFGLALGAANLSVQRGNGLTASISTELKRTAPGIFFYGTSNAVAQNEDYSLNTPANGARPGKTLIVYMTGAGPLSRTLEEGKPSPADDLAVVTSPASATIGGQEAAITFLGMTPGLIGVLQANIVVPELPAGQYKLAVTIGGEVSNEVEITVSDV